MKLIKAADKIIEYSFYALFLLVPLVFTSKTSEIFELNKIWLIFGLTIVIGFSWILKIILLKKIFVQRTPLDIPIILFLTSQIISTIFSLDTHVSIWGYYSRFNGGLLTISAYIFLYYAFLSNFDVKSGLKKMAVKIIKISLAGGFIVALFGLPSHFGYDPTCLILRGSLDVSCWTADFQPKIRIFSTLGQPDWLGAYLAILAPLALYHVLSIKYQVSKKFFIHTTFYILLTTLFYVDILFTKSRSTFLAVWISFFFLSFFFLYFEKVKLSTNLLKEKTVKIFVGITTLLLIITFFAGQPFTQLDKFTFTGIQDSLKHTKEVKTPLVSSTQEFGGTDSGKIRLLVWEGALNAWRNNPIIGTGVETFAFAYYKYRPVEHNLTSEWNYLYNKAHNEFLNYLATTGALGLLTYLSIIIFFLYISLKNLKSSKLEKQEKLLVISLVSSFLSILVTNFFGFSISITNVYLFLIPAFTFVLLNLIDGKNVFLFPGKQNINFLEKLSLFQKLDITVLFLGTLFLIFNLFNFWTADILYAYGQGLDGSGEYQNANSYLRTAVERVNFEPVFKDSLSLNDASLTLFLIEQTQGKDLKTNQLIQGLAGEAVGLNDQLTKAYPNNIIFLKSRVKIFYNLSQIDPKYLSSALDAIKKAKNLAPNDANISYNLGLLYGQTGDNKNAIKTLENTIKLKPNYINAYYALGIFYHQEGVNEKAISEMEFILKNLDHNNKDAKDAIDAWSKQL